MSRSISTIDMHCEGEPSRVLTDSHRLLQGSTMAERFNYARLELDWLRLLLLREPRGYPGLCGSIILPPISHQADFGLIIMNQAGFSPMSGSNSICAVAAMMQAGMLNRSEGASPVSIDTAVGIVRAQSVRLGESTEQVRVFGVPNFVEDIDVELHVQELGTVNVGVAFGGQFVVLVDSRQIGLSLNPRNAKNITRAGALIKMAAMAEVKVRHPDNPDIDYIGLVMFYEPLNGDETCIQTSAVITQGGLDSNDPETWKGTLDRSPCGNATNAYMALLCEAGKLNVGEKVVSRGVLGTTFRGQVEDIYYHQGRMLVSSSITGRAWMTSQANYLLQDADPFPQGYTVSDIWSGSA